jgi:hypothetical protein
LNTQGSKVELQLRMREHLTDVAGKAKESEQEGDDTNPTIAEEEDESEAPQTIGAKIPAPQKVVEDLVSPETVGAVAGEEEMDDLPSRSLAFAGATPGPAKASKVSPAWLSTLAKPLSTWRFERQ